MSYYSGLIKKGQLNDHELLLVEQAVRQRGKNMVVAYVLWFFLGMLGGHRFYMNRPITAIVQLVLSLTVVGMMITSLWWIADAFLLHGYVQDKNRELENDVVDEILASRETSGDR
ncbi:TM2 domain-containing protein [Xylanibacillus composti]|uniref:TM2 domain-containing protein n=1 Tax=Xylanibacillus composti TaxID=1572762 RepID=A0A8J4M2D9_9BACL|nr:TM2 domain-containing protein [Xylanibacillus composti]MDT9726028.1 TM2 domain-containing protein [Xylanibacillus composti]GIQ68827.1 hypothetical protein XYCOK13_16510 [Xylanibacillus composti]